MENIGAGSRNEFCSDGRSVFASSRDSFTSLARSASSRSRKAFEQQVDHLFIKRINSQCQDQWSENRRKLAVVIDSVATELLLATMILANLILSIIATDAEAAGQDVPRWMDACMSCFVAAYCAEVLLRIYVLRWEFFMSNLNVFDMIVVAADLIIMGVGFVSAGRVAADCAPVRLVRVVRLLRSARVLILFRSLYILVNGIASAMAAVMWALLMISLALTMCSVFAVEIIQPYILELSDTTDVFEGCSRCLVAYSSVWHAYVTFFQHIVVGDSWGILAVPVMDAYPWTAFFFIPTWLFIQLCLLNMILAVIVDKAADARESNCALMLSMKEQQQREAMDEMANVFTEMDKDCSGELTIDEILRGYDTNQSFKNTIQLMDIDKDELKAVFNILDRDRSGSCTYAEFTDALWKMKQENTHTLLVFIKSYVLDVKQSLEESLKWLKQDINIMLAEIHSQDPGRDGGAYSKTVGIPAVCFTEPPPGHQAAQAAQKSSNMNCEGDDEGLVSSAYSKEPPPHQQEARASETSKRVNVDDDDGVLVSSASNRQLPPRHQEARAAEECQGTRMIGSAVVSTGCIEPNTGSLPRRLPTSSPKVEHSL